MEVAINNTGNYNGYIAKLDSLVNTIPTIKVQLLTQTKRMEIPIRLGMGITEDYSLLFVY